MGEGDIEGADGGGGILSDWIASCEEMSAIEEETAKQVIAVDGIEREEGNGFVSVGCGHD